MQAYGHPYGAAQATAIERSRMSDKSPRQSKTAKTGKSIKEKRADKRAKTDSSAHSSMEELVTKKKR